MSHPANYVWVEDGRRTTAAHRWGAHTLPRDVIWGPDSVRSLAQDAAEQVELFAELFCDGAVLGDADRRRLLLFGGSDVRWNRALQLAFVDVLRQTWPGWQVDWAFGGWAQIAGEAGLPLRAAGADQLRQLTTLSCWRPQLWPRAAMDLSEESVAALWHRPIDDETLYFDRSAGWLSVLTTPGPHGPVDRPVGEHPVDLLRTGPVVLGMLEDHPVVPPVPAMQEADGGALIDPGTRALHYWLGEEEPSWLPGALRTAWPDWTLHREDAGLAAQLVRTGRDPSPVAVDPALMRREVVRMLFDESEVAALDDLVARRAELAQRPVPANRPGWWRGS